MTKKKKKAEIPKSRILPLIAVISLCIVASFAYRYHWNATDAKGTDGKSSVIALTGNTFKQTITSGVSVIDFWAAWCGPCRLQAPIMEDLARRYAGRAVIAKVDVDADGRLAESYDIRNIPTVVIFKDGKEIKRFIGVTDENNLAHVVNELLKGTSNN